MVGKATLFVVAGFSLIFLIVERNMGTSSTRAVENFVDYYLESYAHELAASGAELAANKIFFDNSWTAGYSNLDYKGGKINVKVDIIDAYQNIRKITSVGEYQTVKKTVEVTLSPSKFSKFAYYTVSEGSFIWWTSSDTVWGPLHSQDMLKIDGDPVFYGKVTTKKGYMQQGKSHPQFLGGYESGVDVPLPPNAMNELKNSAEADGNKITGKDTVYITFVSDSIKVKYTYKGAETSYLASSFSNNGVIYIENAKTVRLQGTVKGQYTLASNKADVYLDNDIVYNTDPRTNPNSTDMLGIVAQNDVLITNNAVNNHDINIDASIYCAKGSFQAEDYDKRPVSGRINLLGGIIQFERGPVGTFTGWGIKSGFYKTYRFDERFLTASPPGFPGTGMFEIVSWYE
jgi:hypothetical protein